MEKKTIKKLEAKEGFVENMKIHKNGIDVLVSIPKPKKPVRREEWPDKFYRKALKNYEKRLDEYNKLKDADKVYISCAEKANPCEKIDLHAHDLIDELKNAEKEKSFAICRNGYITDVVEGSRDKIHTGTYFEDYCKQYNSDVWIDVHNHPSGVNMPTIADMVNVAQEGGGNTWACVVTKETVTCVRPKGEAREIADKLEGMDKHDIGFRRLYDEYARKLQSHERWRSYDVVEKNIDIARCE